MTNLTSSKEIVEHWNDVVTIIDEDLFVHFIEEYGSGSVMDHWENYESLCDTFEQESVDEFIDNFSIEDLNQFEDSYMGKYYSEEEFTEEYIFEYGQVEIPNWIKIDFKLTWDTNLCYDFVFSNHYVFNRNF